MAKKEAGGKSSSQNDFLEPLAPENVTSADVGTNRPYDDGALTVTWTVNALSPAPTSYSVKDSSDNVLDTGSLPTPNGNGVYSVTVESLSSNTSYTIKVVLTNSSGDSDPTSASAVTVTTVPQAPQNPSATSTTADQDIISWTNGANGGKTITSTYFVSTDLVTNPDPVTMTTNPWTEPENGGSAQSYTLYHVNDNGTSLGSSTNQVTTVSPFFTPFFPPYFPPYFPPFFPPYFPPYFPPFFPPYFPPYFPPRFPYFPPFFPPYFPPRFPFFPPRFAISSIDPRELDKQNKKSEEDK
jgi:hypothetical protein